MTWISKREVIKHFLNFPVKLKAVRIFVISKFLLPYFITFVFGLRLTNLVVIQVYPGIEISPEPINPSDISFTQISRLVVFFLASAFKVVGATAKPGRNRLWDMAPSGLVKRAPAKVLGETDGLLSTIWWQDLVRDFKLLSESEIRAPCKVGAAFTTVSGCVNPFEYLLWLRSELESRGVVFHRQYIRSLDEVQPLVGKTGLLVNATSLAFLLGTRPDLPSVGASEITRMRAVRHFYERMTQTPSLEELTVQQPCQVQLDKIEFRIPLHTLDRNQSTTYVDRSHSESDCRIDILDSIKATMDVSKTYQHLGWRLSTARRLDPPHRLLTSHDLDSAFKAARTE
ncbi:uncharacterized protein F5891DRAFT_1195972 [Suillus fuscotomentosus]|uniref:Uncharacterized protein n=1 Tax=Suillus fuscotomentosus TaxID=1912939 RepID=A0AAD4DTM3_9AGAM|nr:uncharacterized protein F5891DRAFT_1195972 [Suillus fuscotomentosus]KAG1893735.1 hypothetical protein F5891DRAFT_1195972 [Suillus fuscotomentosus]